MNHDQQKHRVLYLIKRKINYRSAVQFPRIGTIGWKRRARRVGTDWTDFNSTAKKKKEKTSDPRINQHTWLYMDASNYVTIPRRYSTIKSSSNYAKRSTNISLYTGCSRILICYAEDYWFFRTGWALTKKKKIKNWLKLPNWKAKYSF